MLVLDGEHNTIDKAINNLKKEKRQLIEDLYDKDFYNRIEDEIERIPKSNGSKYYRKININIAMIGDDFSYQLFKDAANIYRLDNKNYQQILGKEKIDYLLIVPPTNYSISHSATNKYVLIDEVVKEIIDYGKKLNINSILYDMEAEESSISYAYYLKDCSFVFTVQREKIKTLKLICEHNNIFEIGLAFNPFIHNPIGKKLNDGENTNILHLRSISSSNKEAAENADEIKYDLFDERIKPKIIDADFYEIENKDTYPLELIDYVSPKNCSYLELARIYKLYDWSIVINERKYCETSCSPQIYELLATGSNVISNYNVFLNNQFPNVFIVSNRGESKEIINSYKKEETFEHQVSGIRMAFKTSTIFDQLSIMLETIGFAVDKLERKVLIVVEDKHDPTILEMIQSQTYKQKEIISINELTKETYDQFDMIAFFNKDYSYGSFYLDDMVNAFKYTNSNYVTKNCFYENGSLVSGIEFNYTSEMNDKYVSVFWRESFELDELINLEGPRKINNGFSIDRFEFKNKLNVAEREEENKEYKLSVIVPIYNNWRFLLYKCFNSLKRSTMFHEMEILLIDDGSSDGITPNIVKRLCKQYKNVKSFYFNDGGSGSASRPRNKGHELATSKYITYLDPDNEAVNDGYFKLYQQINKTDFDFIIGTMKTLSNKKELLAIYGKREESINPVELLVLNNFKPQSIQALIIRKDFILRHKLEMVVGAAGQDTLFFQELMINAKKVKVTEELVHIYYSAVLNSTVNSINKKYFNKVYLREIETHRRFKKYGLLDEYCKRRFEHFFKHWYLRKIVNVKDSDIVDSIDILYKIYLIYKDDLILKDEDVINFIRLYENKNIELLTNDYIHSLRT